MRKALLMAMVMGMTLSASYVCAEDIAVKWQDLGQAKRSQILNQWKQKSRAERGPWVVFRDEYLSNMNKDEKEQFVDNAKLRAEREAKQERLFEDARKKQTEETADKGQKETETSKSLQPQKVKQGAKEMTSETLNPPIVRKRSEKDPAPSDKKESKIKNFFKKIF